MLDQVGGLGLLLIIIGIIAAAFACGALWRNSGSSVITIIVVSVILFGYYTLMGLVADGLSGRGYYAGRNAVLRFTLPVAASLIAFWCGRKFHAYLIRPSRNHKADSPRSEDMDRQDTNG